MAGKLVSLNDITIAEQSRSSVGALVEDELEVEGGGGGGVGAGVDCTLNGRQTVVEGGEEVEDGEEEGNEEDNNNGEDQEEENNNDTTIKKPPPKIKKRRFAILSPLATFNLYESDRHEITKLFHRVNTRPEDPEEDAKPILFHQNTNCRFKLFPNGDISLVVDSQQNHHHITTSIDEDKKNKKNNKNSKTKNNKNNSKKCTNQQFAVPQLTPLSVAM